MGRDPLRDDVRGDFAVCATQTALMRGEFMARFVRVAACPIGRGSADETRPFRHLLSARLRMFKQKGDIEK